MSTFVENDIEKLELDEKIIKILKNNNVSMVKELWQLRRQDLKKMELTDTQINHIIVHLQLKGYDLNKKTY